MRVSNPPVAPTPLGLRTDTEYEGLFLDTVLALLTELTGCPIGSQEEITIGAETFRVDFTIRVAADRIAIEIDGANKGPNALTHGEVTRRQTALAANGWVVLRFSNIQVRDDPEYCRRQVAVVVATLRERRLATSDRSGNTPGPTPLPPGRPPSKSGTGIGAKALIGITVGALALLGGWLIFRQASQPSGNGAPISEFACPASHPVKGNVSTSTGTRYYQLAGWEFYDRTKPESCFADADAAEAAGFSRPPAQR